MNRGLKMKVEHMTAVNTPKKNIFGGLYAPEFFGGKY